VQIWQAVPRLVARGRHGQGGARRRSTSRAKGSGLSGRASASGCSKLAPRWLTKMTAARRMEGEMPSASVVDSSSSAALRPEGSFPYLPLKHRDVRVDVELPSPFRGGSDAQ